MATRQSPLAVIIIAAGKGTRMRSSLAKVLHPLAGRPLIAHVLALANQLAPQQLITVVGHQAEAVRRVCEPQGATCVLQEPQLGTAHAVAQAAPTLADFEGDVLVLYGDVPMIKLCTVRQLWAEHQRQQAAVTVLTAHVANPHGYGRMIRGASGALDRIVEERDASADERAIREINSGIYCLRASFLFNALDRIGSANAQGEQYLTDVIGIAVAERQTVGSLTVADEREIMGINTRVDLAYAEAQVRRQICDAHMLSGVTIVDPATTVIDADVSIGQDTVIAPQTHLLGHTRIGAGCQVGPHAVIQESTLGDGVQVEPFCLIRAQVISAHTPVAAFSNLSTV